MTPRKEIIGGCDQFCFASLQDARLRRENEIVDGWKKQLDQIDTEKPNPNSGL